MGNRVAGVGQSLTTRRKEEFMGECLGYHLAREASFLMALRLPLPYFHLDLNAGCGYNQKSNTVGTPIVFMRQATKYPRLPIDACFVERNPAAVAGLRGHMAAFGAAFNGDLFGLHRRFEIVRRDNEEELSCLVQRVSRFDRPRHARGSIISDPNGWSRYGGAVALPSLRATLDALPNFMLLQFFPWGLAEMVRGWAEKDPARRADVRTIDDFLPLRPHWLISRSVGAPPNVYLCGTAQRYRPGRHEFAIESTEGRAILAHIRGKAA